MNRAMRKASERNGQRLQGLEWNPFKDVTQESLERHKLFEPQSTYRPHQVFTNNRYIVQCFRGHSVLGMPAIKTMIRRSDAKPIYSWGDLQRIKNEIWGEEVQALQMFPRQSELIDDANLYWMWVLL